MPQVPPQSYLLRLWRERAGAPTRVMLVAVGQPDQRRHFTTLADCFAWLSEQAAVPEESSNDLDRSTCIVSQIEEAEK